MVAVRVAAVQFNVQDDKERNVQKAVALASQAASSADFVVLPEYFVYLGPEEGKLAASEPVPGPTIARFADLARHKGVYILCGSIPERSPHPGRVYNTSVLLSPKGEIAARYRKIHLFDVDLGPELVYRESECVVPGDQPVVADTDFGRVGLSICYDLRFPELYRRLTQDGAVLITVPAAFTAETGKDHWEVLLRARAIENQVYVVAAATMGSYPPDRKTHGRSLIVDPWGLVLAQAPDAEGVIYAEVNLEHLSRIRQRIPALRHRKLHLFNR